MRFLLGVLVGYSMRGKKKLLITILATVAFFVVYIILPAVLLVLSLDIKRSASPAQTRVPAIKGMSYGAVETKLQAYDLNIRILLHVTIFHFSLD